MAGKATVAIDIYASSQESVAAFNDTSDAAKNMGKAVDTASKQASDGASRVDRAADASDNLASKSSQATGGLGALASGMSLVGAEKYAMGLEAAAMATDFFSGVGDIANLVLQSAAVQKAKDIALSTAMAIKTAAVTAATSAWTAAQWLLNAALNANPLGLLVLAIGAAVVAIGVLYLKSDSFRALVNKVASSVVSAFQSVVSKIGDLVGWFRDKLPAAGRVAKTLIVGYIKLITLPTRLLISAVTSLVGWIKDKLPGAWQAAKDAVSSKVTAIRELIGRIASKVSDIASGIRDKISDAMSKAKDKIQKPIEAVVGFFQPLKDLIDKVVSALGNIKFPKPPGWLTDVAGGLGGLIPKGKAGSALVAPTRVANVVININGAIDPVSTAQQVRDILSRQQLWNGTLVTVT